ncbi:hypothetical protein [Nocardia sp. NPDC058497]|uniref:hypothetical protein n=1 Tax=Nocardia sp. NPDC058497 TaxID=3346529 RepID=UPI0036481399
MSGVRLDQAVAEFGVLPVDAVRGLAVALAQALQGVHGAGLVHQHLRPDTVWLTRDGIELAGIDVIAGAGITPPGYLSPEQSVSGTVSAASDIFALGSVLAFAAGGVAPFAAPSVPYTLFNIAQRDPDFSAVPEPLRELIAGCLRKDPAARPSPAQIIAYVGTRQQGWPPAILAEIDRAARTLVELLAEAPPAAHVESTAPARSRLGSILQASVGFGRERYVTLRARVGAQSVRTRRVLAATIVMLVVASGSLWIFHYEGPAATAQPVGISTAELRHIDSCAWLRAALGDSVALRAGPAPIASWRFEVEHNWACYADQQQRVNGDGMRLRVGVDLREVPPNRKLIDGITVLEDDAQQCRRAIASNDSGRRSGILVEFDEKFAEQQGCAVADQVIAQLARTLRTAPRSVDAAISLSAVDPCALVDRTALASAVSRLTPVPSVLQSVHYCQWFGSAEMTLLATRTSFEPTGSVTVDGITLLTGPAPPGPVLGCGRIYRHRMLDEKQYEAIELAIAGPFVDSDSICRTVESLLVEAVRRLPKT